MSTSVFYKKNQCDAISPGNYHGNYNLYEINKCKSP